MAGHSKWANIQYRKGTQDARKARLFTRVMREVQSAARHGGADPSRNSRLRLAIERANAANVPKDRIERALKRLQGGEATDNFEEVRYEGYGAGGVAILVECLTDNRNRTVSEVRHAFVKAGGNLGADGAVAYLFRRVGVLQYRVTPERAESLFEQALDAGAEDVEDPGNGCLTVIVDPEFFEQVRFRLEAAGFISSSGEVTWQASTQIPVSGDDALSVLKLLASLEELDDVQNLYSNADFSEEAVRRFQDAS